MKRLFSILLAVLLLMSLAAPASAAETSNPVPKAKQAVVRVASGIYYQNGKLRTYDSEGRYSTGTAFGVYSEDGGALVFATNGHVVSDSRGNVYEQVYICIDGADIYKESTMIRCDILYVDNDIDVAIIKAAAPIIGVGTLPLMRPEELQTGDGIFALGFPGIADKAADENNNTAEDITVTDGIISRYLTSDGVKCMAHTAAVNHGNSGGPLINMDGQAIGINTFIYADQSTADLRCYAIYIDYVMDALDELDIPYEKVSKEDSVPAPTAPEQTEPADEAPQTQAAPDASGEEEAKPWYKTVLPIAGIVIAVTAVVVVLVVTKRKKNRVQMPSLVVAAMSGPLQGRSWALGNSVTIGRDPSCTVVFPADTKGLSRNHCRIDRANGQILVTDLGSTYGTFVGGRKLPANTPIPISTNVEIWLGGDAIRMIIR